MKTNIKLRVTPEQSEAIQKICFANGVKWRVSGKKIAHVYAQYLLIKANGLGYYTYNAPYIEAQKYTEVDADLFIRTNGTCEEPEETIKVCGEEYVLTNEDKEYLYSKRPTSLHDTTKAQSTIELECQFAKYGFEKPDFECELFGTVSGPFENDQFVVGVLKKGMFNNCPHMWSVKYGTCYTSTLASNMPEYNLTPIKKPWYETCKFPCLVKDRDDTFTISTTEGYSERYLATLTPLTNDEIEGLKQ